MDRTAWIAVTLCVIGLVVWQIYVVKQTPPRHAPVSVAPEQTSPSASIPSSTPLAAPAAAPKAAEPVASFPEKIETLRNSDVELRFTNRGGGIAEAVMFNHIAEDAKRVTLNSPKHTP